MLLLSASSLSQIKLNQESKSDLSLKSTNRALSSYNVSFSKYISIEYGIMFVVHPPMAYALGSIEKEPYMHLISVTGNLSITKNTLFGWIRFGGGYYPDDEGGISLATGIRYNILFEKRHFISLGAGVEFLFAKSFPSAYLVFDASYSFMTSKNIGLTAGINALPRISKDNEDINLKNYNFFLLPQIGIQYYF